jgi:hypothetical protein
MTIKMWQPTLGFWVDVKLDKIFFFQQELIASTSLQKSSNI